MTLIYVHIFPVDFYLLLVAARNFICVEFMTLALLVQFTTHMEFGHRIFQSIGKRNLLLRYSVFELSYSSKLCTYYQNGEIKKNRTDDVMTFFIKKAHKASGNL